MAQACKASRLSSHILPSAAAAASTNIVTSIYPTSVCARIPKILLLPRGNSSCDRRVEANAHSSHKFSNIIIVFSLIIKATFGFATKLCSTNGLALTPPYSKSTQVKTYLPVADKLTKNSVKLIAIVIFNCEKTGHVAAAFASDTKSARKCLSCGGVCHLALNCATRAAQSTAQASFCLSTNAIGSAGNSADQVFTEAVIGGVRIADALVNTG